LARLEHSPCIVPPRHVFRTRRSVAEIEGIPGVFRGLDETLKRQRLSDWGLRSLKRRPLNAWGRQRIGLVP
jgi:hypothetical protein